MNAQLTTQIANHLQVSPNQIKEIREWAKVFWVAVHGQRPTFVSRKVVKMAIEIEVCDMKAADKPGYVAKIGENREKFFLNPKAYSAFGTSAKKVQYEIKEDGIFEICDANFGWRKRRVSFVLVRNGKIVFESESLREVETKESALDGKSPDWAVMSEENLGLKKCDRTIEDSSPNYDVEIKAGENFLRVTFHSDDGFRFFLPAMKLRVPGRKWNESRKAWDIPQESVIFLREIVEEYTIRTNGMRKKLEVFVSSKAQYMMAIDTVNA